MSRLRILVLAPFCDPDADQYALCHLFSCSSAGQTP